MPAIVSITPALAEVYKQVRLRALQDSPSAFGSTFARESQLTEAEWQQRIASLDGARRTGFLAIDGGEACGLCLGFLEDHDPTRAEVISMWVAPTHRRTGLSVRLLDAVCNWAASRSAAQISLMVTSVNPVAESFYRSYGFQMSGRTEPYPNDAAVLNLEMVRVIG